MPTFLLACVEEELSQDGGSGSLYKNREKKASIPTGPALPPSFLCLLPELNGLAPLGMEGSGGGFRTLPPVNQLTR